MTAAPNRHDNIGPHRLRCFVGYVLLMVALCTTACSDGTGPTGASRLVFLVEPVSVGLGSPLAPTVVVAVQNEAGRIVRSWSDAVTVSLEAEGGNGTLVGTTRVVPTEGVAAFDDLQVDAVGDAFTLVASSGALRPGTSKPFAVRDVFRAASVTAGGSHTCALAADGTAYCWGNNFYGQLGDGTDADRSVPHRVATDLKFTLLRAGWGHTCGIAQDGTGYCWGDNYGALGDGTTQPAYTPQQVDLAAPLMALDVSESHSCALTDQGRAYCWGYNSHGQLGDGTDTTRLTPTPVATGLTFATISTAHYHTCALTADGTAHCWGISWATGDGDDTFFSTFTPTPVVGGHRFTSLSAGDYCCGHTCAVANDGQTYYWGSNYQRNHYPDRYRLAPTPLAGDAGFRSVSVGGFSVCGIGIDGGLYCWGGNRYGQIGNATTEYVELPTAVLTDRSFVSVSAGTYHACAVTTEAAITGEGAVYCWGSNTSGELGNGSNRAGWAVPVPVWKPESGG